MPNNPKDARVVRLRLDCLDPPARHDDACVEFGLQDKHGALDPGQAQPDGAVRYELDLGVSGDPSTGPLRLRGPNVHGPATAPFLYLSLRRKDPDPASPASWIRRLKIPLASIGWDQIVAAGPPDRGVLEAVVAGTGSATVPLLNGAWTPSRLR